MQIHQLVILIVAVAGFQSVVAKTAGDSSKKSLDQAGANDAYLSSKSGSDHRDHKGHRHGKRGRKGKHGHKRRGKSFKKSNGGNKGASRKEQDDGASSNDGKN